MMKPKLIKNWRRAWKLFSVQLMAIGAGVSAQYGIMYEQMHSVIPPKVMAAVTGVVFMLGIIGRVVAQSDEKSEDQ